ncbi:hypothetical protein BH24ACI3_BH24ACI3_11890 [soil metagenome]
MRKFRKSGLALTVFVAAIIFFAVDGYGQLSSPSSVGKTIFLDSDGNQISNNEFVDIRLANFNLKDTSLMRMLEDGTFEFRLQKVPQEGVTAPDVRFNRIDGQTLSMAELRGKVVVLNFWFIGCPVCHAEKPQLNELRSKFIDDERIVFIAVTADSASSVRKFVAKVRFDYIQTADADIVQKQFVVGSFPKNIVVSKTGEIVYWRSPVKAWEKFESVIRSELDK